MKLTADQHPEAIRRYAHVKRAFGWGVRRCAVGCPGTRHTCTRVRRHSGPHVSHGAFNKVRAVWDSGAAGQGGGPSGAKPSGRPPVDPTPRVPAARRPIGLRQRRPSGFLESVGQLFIRLADSIESVALLIFFLAFVWFAIDWLLLIMG